MRRIAIPVLLAFAFQLPAGPRARAQEASASEQLRVFLDCPTGGCDRDAFVTDLPFILWTQRREDADVHLLITRIGTGAGGGEYTFEFLGQRRFANRVDTLVSTVPPNITDDFRRRELSRVTRIGLVAFAAKVEGVSRFSVAYVEPIAGTVRAPGALQDPWDFWVFRLRSNGSGSAESRSSSYEITGGVNASRITEDWKLTFNAQNEYRFSRFKTSDTTENRFFLRNADASARVVKSVSNHWSVGTRLAGGLSEFRNQDFYGALDLSAEYNVYPWREATSRQLIGVVALGSRYYDYREVTIFDRTTEHRPVARAIIAGEWRRPWGTVDASLRYTRFLHDNDTYSITANGRTNFRLSRGLSLELRGEATKVNDQLFLARGSATPEQVLTRQRALATAYRLNGTIGLTFTFGSIFNTIVNPRLDDIGG